MAGDKVSHFKDAGAVEAISRGDVGIITLLVLIARQRISMALVRHPPHLPRALSPQVLQCQWFAQSTWGTRRACAVPAPSRGSPGMGQIRTPKAKMLSPYMLCY